MWLGVYIANNSECETLKQIDQDMDEMSGDGEDDRGDVGDVVLRFNLVLKNRWEEALADKTSEDFAEMSSKLSSEIQNCSQTWRGNKKLQRLLSGRI